MCQDNAATRASLLVRLRDPTDGDSWQTFLDTYGPLLYHYSRRRGLQDADAADVAQDTLTEVVRAIRTFEYRPEIGRFRDWLGTLAFHKLMRFLERRKRREIPAGGDSALQGPPRAECPTPDAEWIDEFNAQLLRVAQGRIRGHFEPTTWRAFELAWLENRPAPEVARDLGVTIEKVYVAKARVLKRLEEEVLMLAEDAPQRLAD